MNILRRASTRQLIIGIVAIVVIAGGGAVAFAGGGGPKPPHRSLASALHVAASAKPVQGVTARVQFTDHLVASDALGSSSPLISGATGRIWVGGGKLRLELQSSAGDTEIGFDGNLLTVYDVSSSTAYTLRVPHHHHSGTATHRRHGVPSVAEIRKGLAKLAQHVDLSGAIPGDIAGRPSYSVRVSPRHSGGLLGSVELAWDATHGVPLRIAVYSRTDSSPVLSLTVTDISYGAVSASDLRVPLAPGTKVVKVHAPAPSARPAGMRSQAHRPAITGVAAVARAVPFRLSAPASVVGLPRKSVRVVEWSGTQAAMAVYGRGLGAVVVLEQPATASATPKRSPLAALPGVSIDGASGHELDTALGTLIQFDRGGVRYTVIGSLPPAAAEAAARAIG
jgi:hypothetical protein